MSIRDDMLALIQGPPMDEYDRGVSDALTVFEAAHAKELGTPPEPQTEPTDDEREALAWAEYPDEVSDHAGYQEARRQGFESGFQAALRRTAVQEPSDAQVFVALNAWYAKEREQNGWPIGSNAAELADYSPQTQDRMRAALRAALAEQSVKVVCSCPCHTTVGYKHIANCC